MHYAKYNILNTISIYTLYTETSSAVAEMLCNAPYRLHIC